MVGELDKDGSSGVGHRRTYSRSISWSDRSPTKGTPNPRPQWNSKARACLPPLQPLSVTRPRIEEWPRAGSDDLGVWPNPPTPGVRLGSVSTRESTSSRSAPLEFEFKKDKLAFFNKECSRIVDHIYLGSDTVAKNREVLRQNGITHVLNCVGYSCPEYFKNDLVYKTLWLQDSPSEDITSVLYDVFDYFEDVREQGGRVLVHCCQGVSRSTSLVIAYLMWKDGQSFEDAFQHVKAARGVTNPNMGFACQLLQCQKRVHALPASPSSALRIYRMAPHSPYDPLHLVPKMVSELGENVLDSRGAFIVHIPSAIYIWIGKYCSLVMSDNAKAAAFQVIRYEKAQGPVITISEGEEPSGFWNALGNSKFLPDDCSKMEKEASEALVTGAMPGCVGERKVSDYDVDFDIFHKALAGGVVPPFPLSGTGSETCLPARENGWSRLRRKFASGIMKEFILSSKLISQATQTIHGLNAMNTGKEPGYLLSVSDPSSPSSPKLDSPDSFSSYATSSSPSWMRNTGKDVEHTVPLVDPPSSPTPSFGSLNSFSCFSANKPKSSLNSPSLSPSTSDYSSSFTFSPSSSNWSDLSYFSAQPSPSGMESYDPCSSNNASFDETPCLICKGTNAPQEAFCSSPAEKVANTCVPCRKTDSSLAERRGNNPPPRMKLPSLDESSQVPASLLRSWSFSLPDVEDDVIRDVSCIEFKKESNLECSREEQMVDADNYMTDNEFQSGTEDDNDCGTLLLPSNCMTESVAKVTDVIFYQWPTLHKVKMHRGILDSRSVYIAFKPAASFSTKDSDVLYVWVGRDVSLEESQNQSIAYGSTVENGHSRWETVGRDFLTLKGLAKHSVVQVVKEGEEPDQLLEHLPHFSFPNTLDNPIN